MLKEGNSPFNDAGESMMTHNQYRDYSEPSEEEYEDGNMNDSGFDAENWFKQEMQKNNIKFDSYCENEYGEPIQCTYSIPGHSYGSLGVVFNGTQINISNGFDDHDLGEPNWETKTFDLEFDTMEDVLDYISQFKDLLARD